MTTIAPRHFIEVEPHDPEYMTHATWDVRHPSRAQQAEQEDARARRLWAARGGDPQAYVPHREFPCPGTLRVTNRESKTWTVQCDRCGYRMAAPRGHLDQEIMVAKRLEAARLPLELATKDLTKTTGNEAARSVLRVLVERWGTELEPHPPVLVGANGRGKTHMLASAGYQLVKRRLVQVRYWPLPDLLAAARRHMDAEGEGAEAFIARQANVQLLILDDLGAERDSPWGREVLQRIVDWRESRKLRTMCATNLPEDQWDVAWGARTASRLRGMTTLVEVHGEDWRERDDAPAAAGIVVPLRPHDSAHDPSSPPGPPPNQ